jgi:hypothetical protein
MTTTAELLMTVRHHFTLAEQHRIVGGTYDASEGSPAAVAIQAAMRNMMAAGFSHAECLSTLRELASDVVRTVRATKGAHHA